MAACCDRSASARSGSHLRLTSSGRLSRFESANILFATLNTETCSPKGKSSMAPGFRRQHRRSSSGVMRPPTREDGDVTERTWTPRRRSRSEMPSTPSAGCWETHPVGIGVLGPSCIEGASLGGRDRKVLAVLVLDGPHWVEVDRLAD